MKLKNFELEETGQTVPKPLPKCVMRLDLHKVEDRPLREPYFDVRYEYHLALKVYAKFVANRAELNRARENAEHLLLDALYRDVITELLKIRTLSDSPEVDMEIGKLISKLRGGAC